MGGVGDEALWGTPAIRHGWGRSLSDLGGAGVPMPDLGLEPSDRSLLIPAQPPREGLLLGEASEDPRADRVGVERALGPALEGQPYAQLHLGALRSEERLASERDAPRRGTARELERGSERRGLSDHWSIREAHSEPVQPLEAAPREGGRGERRVVRSELGPVPARGAQAEPDHGHIRPIVPHALLKGDREDADGPTPPQLMRIIRQIMIRVCQMIRGCLVLTQSYLLLVKKTWKRN